MPKLIYTLFMKVVTMDRKNLLIAGSLAGGLIVVIIVLVIGVFIIIPSIANNLTSNSNENLTRETNENTVTFDNSTHEATAKSIARLDRGAVGFYTWYTVNASLTSDGKYWIVNMHGRGYEWVVTVDAKTLMSKKNGGYGGFWDSGSSFDEWISFDELKARYIAEIQSKSTEEVGKPHKITMNGKEIWEVPVYGWGYDIDPELVGYVYVDVATGKSKKVYSGIFNELYSKVLNTFTWTDGWLTLKEVDKGSKYHWTQNQDALRDLYPE